MYSENRFTTMNRRDFLRLGGAGLAGATLLGTAGGLGSGTDGIFSGGTVRDRQKVQGSGGVAPVMGYYNTLDACRSPPALWKGDPEGRSDYGMMQLTQNPSRNTLGKAAKLTGLSEARLKNDRSANIEGGAALLSNLVGKTKPKSLDGWQEALTRYGHGPVHQPGLRCAQGRGLYDHLDW